MGNTAPIENHPSAAGCDVSGRYPCNLSSFHSAVFPAAKFEQYNSSMLEAPLRIRNYREEDLDVLCRIDQICFPEYMVFSRADFVFHLSHPKRIARVAEASGRIIGFILVRIHGSSYAHVITLDVVPDARQRRVGTRLMDDLHKAIERRKIGACVLEVGVRNVTAQHLYEKLQYRYMGTLPGYYRDREDAYRMVRLSE
jgi:[ribosomal protein S18]-alanine N-acetyltransferase